MAGEVNSLVSTKPSDSNLQIALHPLVLLTISDHITRHHVRGEAGFVVGALLGQVEGRNVTIEHAFPCNLIDREGEIILHMDWFEERLQQYKDVHKQPALELVGWSTVTSESGPSVAQLPIHQQIMTYIESPILLAFHSSSLSSMSSNTTGKLPLTLYEAIEAGEQSPNHDDTKGKDTNAMQLDTEDSKTPPLQFRALSYSVETEETEMIAIDYVAKGGGNATAVDTSSEPSDTAERKSKRGAGKPSAEAMGGGTADDASAGVNHLSSEDEDLIATLSTRLNSVRMLQSRIAVLQDFIKSLPSSYLSSSDAPLTQTSPSPEILPYVRQINALITRLSLLTPSPLVQDESAPTTQAEMNLTGQANDTNLTSLLALLSRNIQGANELGRKFSATEQTRQNQKQSGKMMSGKGARFDFMGDRGAVEPDFDLE